MIEIIQSVLLNTFDLINVKCILFNSQIQFNMIECGMLYSLKFNYFKNHSQSGILDQSNIFNLLESCTFYSRFFLTLRVRWNIHWSVKSGTYRLQNTFNLFLTQYFLFLAMKQKFIHRILDQSNLIIEIIKFLSHQNNHRK